MVPPPYVLNGVVEEEAVIAPIVNDDMHSHFDFDYESDEESDFYYPSSPLVELDSSRDESLLSQSNIDFVDQLVDDDSDLFNGNADFSDQQYSDDEFEDFALLQRQVLADHSDLDDSNLLDSTYTVETVAEVVTLSERHDYIFGDDIVAEPSVVSRKRKAEDTVFAFSNKKHRTKYI